MGKNSIYLPENTEYLKVMSALFNVLQWNWKI